MVEIVSNKGIVSISANGTTPEIMADLLTGVNKALKAIAKEEEVPYLDLKKFFIKTL